MLHFSLYLICGRWVSVYNKVYTTYNYNGYDISHSEAIPCISSTVDITYICKGLFLVIFVEHAIMNAFNSLLFYYHILSRV
jgi:hypothetical protein